MDKKLSRETAEAAKYILFQALTDEYKHNGVRLGGDILDDAWEAVEESTCPADASEEEQQRCTLPVMLAAVAALVDEDLILVATNEGTFHNQNFVTDPDTALQRLTKHFPEGGIPFDPLGPIWVYIEPTDTAHTRFKPVGNLYTSNDSYWEDTHTGEKHYSDGHWA